MQTYFYIGYNIDRIRTIKGSTMKQLNAFFVIALILFSSFPVNAATPVLYNKELPADNELKGALFTDGDASGFYAAYVGDSIQITSTNHYTDKTIKIKGTALTNRLKMYDGLKVGYTHIADDGSVTHEIKSLIIDIQGFAYLTCDFSTVIINGMTGITTNTYTNQSGNQSFNVPDGSSYDLSITNNQPATYTAYSDIGGNQSSFEYKKEINISHSGALTNYQTLLNITYNANMQADFDDIRFSYSNGTYIPYWIESKTDNSTADVWIKSGLVDGNTIINMYYGNAGLSSGSNWGDTILPYVDSQATSAAGFTARSSHTSAVFDNKMWVIAGYDAANKNDIWYSSDGITWTQATAAAGFSARRLHQSVVFDNKMWVIGGYATANKNDVWYSSDGITWTQATAAAGFSARYAHQSVIFDNKMWVIGGYDGAYKRDVWYSSDGITWTLATAAAGFSARHSHQSVVFDNKIWVIGGYDGANKNDVWYSSDGVTWAQATAAAGFGARRGHQSVVFDNKMWVIGGYDGVNKNDVWYSSDGVTWTRATAATGFTARRVHESTVFDNKMWVIGGLDTANKNDVWRLLRTYTATEPTYTIGTEQQATGTTNITASVTGDTNTQVYNSSQTRQVTLIPTGTTNNVLINTTSTDYSATISTYWTENTTLQTETAAAGYAKQYINYTPSFDITSADLNTTFTFDFTAQGYIGTATSTLNDVSKTTTRTGQVVNASVGSLTAGAPYYWNITVPYNNVFTLSDQSNYTSNLGTPVSFIDSIYSDPEGLAIDSRLWNFGDGNTSTSSNPIHNYSSEGVYTANYTVTETATVAPQTITKEFNVIILPPVYTVSGYVFDTNSEPVGLAIITNNQTSETAYTDINGYYILSDISPGSVLINATRSSYTNNSIISTVTNTNLINQNITLIAFGITDWEIYQLLLELQAEHTTIQDDIEEQAIFTQIYVIGAVFILYALFRREIRRSKDKPIQPRSR